MRDRASTLLVAWRRAAGLATALAGLLTVVSAVTPDVPWRRQLLLTVEPGRLMSLGHVLAAAVGLALLALGRSMVHGTRRAVDAARVLLLVVALLHLLKGLDFEEATVAMAMAAVLTAGRRAFDRGTASKPGLVAAAVAVGAAAAAWLLSSSFELVTGRAGGPEHALSLGITTLAKGSWWLTSGEPVALALDAAVLASLIASAWFLHSLLRPEQASEGHTPDEHERAVRLVDEHGRDSLAPFLLREDKSYFFAHGGVLAYRVLRETAVVSGDPVCSPGAGLPILAAFSDYARQRGWRVAVAAASEAAADGCRRLGLRAMCVGQEAVVDPQRFTLEGRAVRKIRQSLSRAKRRGWRFEVTTASRLASADVRDIARLELDWRRAQRRLQGFAMTLGRLGGAPEDEQMVHVLARDPSGRVGAVLRFLPYRQGLSLDAMRRTAGAPNGLTEALVALALEYARAERITEVSLNFAGFGHLMAPGRPLNRRERLAQLALRSAHRRFQLERLSFFNQKFDPAWRPRYLLFESRAGLARSGLRVLQAEAYIRAPRQRPLARRWRPREPVPQGVPNPSAVPR